MCGMSSTGLPLADVNGCMYLLFLLFFVFILFALFCLLLLPASVNVSITFFSLRGLFYMVDNLIRVIVKENH